MNKQEYDEWIKKLTVLSAEQLGDLSARIKLLASMPVLAPGRNFGERAVVAICDQFKQMGVDAPSPTALKKSTAYASSKAKFDGLQFFFNKVAKQRIVQDALLRHAVDLLYHDMLQWGVAISAHTIIAQIHRIPATLNRAYPGYAESGLLSKVVNVRNQSDRREEFLQGC